MREKCWRQKILPVVLCLCMLFTCLCACSNKQAAERVSDEGLSKLRKDFPYADPYSPLTQVMYSYDELYPKFDTTLLSGVCAIAVLEFVGEWGEASDTSVKMYDDEKLNQTVPNANSGLRWVVHSAKVKKVLWGGSDLSAGDTITVGFGDIRVVNYGSLEKVFVSGNEYVCFLTDHRYKNFDVEQLYGASLLRSYYLTNKDVVMSVTSTAGFDECSGMYLDAFVEKIKTIVSPPDAELTPLEPELEVE